MSESFIHARKKNTTIIITAITAYSVLHTPVQMDNVGIYTHTTLNCVKFLIEVDFYGHLYLDFTNE